MADITQSLTTVLVSRMNRYRKYSGTEQQIFMYGVELMLNSFLKAAAYLMCGFAVRKGIETLSALLVFGGLRKVSGGAHAKTNSGCFLAGGIILILGITLPRAGALSSMAYWMAALTVWFIYLIYAPCDEYFEEDRENRKEEKRLQKQKALMLAGGVLILGGVLDNYWRMLIWYVSLMQGITLMKLPEKMKR